MTLTCEECKNLLLTVKSKKNNETYMKDGKFNYKKFALENHVDKVGKDYDDKLFKNVISCAERTGIKDSSNRQDCLLKTIKPIKKQQKEKSKKI